MSRLSQLIYFLLSFILSLASRQMNSAIMINVCHYKWDPCPRNPINCFNYLATQADIIFIFTRFIRGYHPILTKYQIPAQSNSLPLISTCTFEVTTVIAILSHFLDTVHQLHSAYGYLKLNINHIVYSS